MHITKAEEGLCKRRKICLADAAERRPQGLGVLDAELCPQGYRALLAQLKRAKQDEAADPTPQVCTCLLRPPMTHLHQDGHCPIEEHNYEHRHPPLEGHAHQLRKKEGPRRSAEQQPGQPAGGSQAGSFRLGKGAGRRASPLLLPQGQPEPRPLRLIHGG